MAFLRQFNIKLLTGDPVEFAVVGNYVGIKASTYDVELKDLTKNDNNSFVLSEGDDVVFDDNFKKLSLRNLGSGDITVTIVIGLNVKLSSSKVGGTVKVVNGEIERVKAGQCFVGMAAAGGTAGNYCHNQLWNPAGSGKLFIVNKLTIYARNVGVIGLLKYNAALADLGAYPVINKDFRSAVASVAQMRTQNNAAVIGSYFANIGYGTLHECVEFPLVEPIIVGQGEGLGTYHDTLSTLLSTSFQWYEESA